MKNKASIRSKNYRAVCWNIYCEECIKRPRYNASPTPERRWTVYHVSAQHSVIGATNSAGDRSSRCKLAILLRRPEGCGGPFLDHIAPFCTVHIMMLYENALR